MPVAERTSKLVPVVGFIGAGGVVHMQPHPRHRRRRRLALIVGGVGLLLGALAATWAIHHGRADLGQALVQHYADITHL